MNHDKQTEALKLALEALKQIDEAMPFPVAKLAQKVIREALAEQPAQQQDNPHPEYCKGYAAGLEAGAISEKKSVQQQEPVAWMDGYRNIYSLEEKAAGCPEANIALVPMANHKKTSGSPINELQCVCGAVWLGEEMVHLPEKRQPASKPWVGLTDEEKADLFEGTAPYYNETDYADAIEAKLREKNA